MNGTHVTAEKAVASKVCPERKLAVAVLSQAADDLQKFDLVDAGGKAYRPVGAWARVMQRAVARMAAVYDPSAPAGISRGEGIPGDVWISFLVPTGTKLKSLNYNGKSIQDLTDKVAQ